MKQMLSILFVLLFISSCAMSPIREVIPENNLALNISIGGAVVDNVQGYDVLPAMMNLSVGASYGITNEATVLLNLYPVALFQGIFILEPAGVYNFVAQEDSIPNVNGALALPMSFSLKNGDFGFYPCIFVGPTYEDDTGIVYTSLELQFDSRDTAFSFGWKVGGEWKAWSSGTVGGEIGLLNIGQQSSVSPLSRIGVGVPVMVLGTSIYFDLE